ncbi:ABC transporter [Grimontia sp. AD028]|uniref:ABC transporter ATP-binding protein n=1 Tax=Grimontia sp. AD028 TaxID=1581149 RepID=UPI00061B4574|nr:ABC transporter ATP-binding protein [Grimontia sp. AD028]KKD61345.1 ABC transporter [Grimontia sp. AD028]
MKEIILEFENVTLEYKTRTGLFKSFIHKALDNVSFKVARGEVIGITGRNGAGKSTLLKVASGVLQPNSGKVIIPNNTTKSLLSLGLGFSPDLSGRDNAIISCMLNGLTKKEANTALSEIKAFSELGGFFEQPVKTYSSGMKSRLGFAIGLITEVDILLIDEILSVGDVNFRKKAEKAMMEKIKDKQTVLFVSHNQAQVDRLCDRIIEL